MHSKGLFYVTKDYILKDDKFLCVCFSMQMMMEKGTEGYETLGLDVIKGEVVAIDEILKSSTFHKITHIGWYEVENVNSTPQNENIFSMNLVKKKQCILFIHIWQE